MALVRMHWNSIPEMVDWYDKEAAKGQVVEDYYYIKELAKEGRKALLNGTTQYVEEIEKISNKIWENVPVLQRTWHLQHVGAFPCVPAYLAGEPAEMFALQEERSEHTPVRIWVGTTSSGGFTNEERIKRGAALASFAQALSELRPVYITPWAEMNPPWRGDLERGSLISWDIQTSPIVMSEVAACLIEPTVGREFSQHLRLMIGNGGSLSQYPGKASEAKCREALGAKEEDLWFNSMNLRDELLADPIGWVKAHLAKYAQEEE